MVKNILTAFMVLILPVYMLTAQTPLRTQSDLAGYKSIPLEKIYVHFNASLLFSGEYLYYKIYTLNDGSNTFSPISKIAYVELVNEEKQVVSRQKINLINGLGTGDFFIPVSLPSGNYQFMAYTKWMTNSEDYGLFHDNLTIINPYQGNQNGLRKDISPITPPGSTGSALGIANENCAEASLNGYSLATEQSIYSTRQKVSVTLKGNSGPKIYGSYSLSARKVEDLMKEHKKQANQIRCFHPMKDIKNLTNLGDYIQLPEMRGELLQGKIKAKDSSPLPKDINVALSIPGEPYLLQIANANKEGDFYFNLNEAYSGETGIFQILGNHGENIEMTIDDSFEPNYSKLSFGNFQLLPEMEKSIKERSIHNQIENGYFSAKPDTIKQDIPPLPFNGEETLLYNLDDYTRFSTIKETVVEIINSVWIKKLANDQLVFQVRGTDSYLESVFLPLVVVDGIVVQDHSGLIGYNARNIKNIKVLKGKYIYGLEVFEGIIAMETIDGDYRLNTQENHVKSMTLFKPEASKIYFKQRYSEQMDSTFKHIPDFRRQLLWLPNLEIEQDEVALEFFTSDVPGEYKIELEGFNELGNPISMETYFTVE